MVTLTTAATTKLSELIQQQGEGILGLRLSAMAGGCSGYQYGMAFAEAAQEGDWVGEFGGVKVFVDPKSLPYIDGTELDFTREGLNEGFRFNNPQVKDECGCGESFRI